MTEEHKTALHLYHEFCAWRDAVAEDCGVEPSDVGTSFAQWLKDELPDVKTPLKALGLSTRAYNALRRAGVDTVEEVRAMSPRQIRSTRNVGEHSLAEIMIALEEYDG